MAEAYGKLHHNGLFKLCFFSLDKSLFLQEKNRTWNHVKICSSILLSSFGGKRQMCRTAESVWPLMRLMILYNTFIIIMSNKQPYLNTFTHSKTIRLTWLVFMLIKFCYLHDTNDPTNKTETDTLTNKNAQYRVERDEWQRCRFKNCVQKWGCKSFW